MKLLQRCTGPTPFDLLFADAIETDSLESDPEVTSELKSAKVEIMKRIWMKRQLNKMVKDEDLVKSYGKIKDSIKGKKVTTQQLLFWMTSPQHSLL